MEFKRLHPWDVNYKEAVQIQRRLQKKLILKKPKGKFHLADMQRVEEATAIGKVKFPYIPGLLSFREAPILLKAFSKIKQMPDIIIVDGQGIAHPRGFG